MNELYSYAVNQATKQYGNNLAERMAKTLEEVNELHDVLQNLNLGIINKEIGTNGIYKSKELVDEMADVVYCINHLSSLLFISMDELLIQAIVKSEIRKEIPNYKRNENNG
jgi:hypothetical protein